MSTRWWRFNQHRNMAEMEFSRPLFWVLAFHLFWLLYDPCYYPYLIGNRISSRSFILPGVLFPLVRNWEMISSPGTSSCGGQQCSIYFWWMSRMFFYLKKTPWDISISKYHKTNSCLYCNCKSCHQRMHQKWKPVELTGMSLYFLSVCTLCTF